MSTFNHVPLEGETELNSYTAPVVVIGSRRGSDARSEIEDGRSHSAWSGVIGAFFGTWFGCDSKRVRRPTVMLTVEGGVGDRQGALVSLRYEYDVVHAKIEKNCPPTDD